MLNVSIKLLHVKYSSLFFAKGVEDWFGYGNFNLFCLTFLVFKL